MSPDTRRPPIVIAAGLRTPFVRAGGAFQQEDAGHLGARLARELVARSGIDPGALDEVIAGCAGPPHDQANIGRVIALRAGIPEHVPARTVARNCASGMEAVTQAVTEIEAGHGSMYLCIGVEVMSAFPLMYNRAATKWFGDLARTRSAVGKLGVLARLRPRMFAPRIALMEGLTDPIPGLIMGKTAEILAREFEITRAEADRYALESHQRAKRARDAGRFAREIVPHLPIGAKGSAKAGARETDGHGALARAVGGAVEHDDGIRDQQTLEALAKLPPYFEKPDGRVTVGNSCGVTDGAAALLVASEERARKLGLAPLARIKSFAYAGLDPARMGLGPVYASALALERAAVTLADIGTIELNEAFAAQVLACARAFASDAFAREELGRSRALGTLDLARTNVNGGAIALGHPVGATGARLLLSAAHELAVGGHALALATLCIGGGQGGAVVLERSPA